MLTERFVVVGLDLLDKVVIVSEPMDMFPSSRDLEKILDHEDVASAKIDKRYIKL